MELGTSCLPHRLHNGSINVYVTKCCHSQILFGLCTLVSTSPVVFCCHYQCGGHTCVCVCMCMCVHTHMHVHIHRCTEWQDPIKGAITKYRVACEWIVFHFTAVVLTCLYVQQRHKHAHSHACTYMHTAYHQVIYRTRVTRHLQTTS